MGEVKRLCRAQTSIPSGKVIVECDKVHGHKGRHHAQWREGIGGRYVDITVRWPRR